jgi:hypothetical protein
MAKKKLDLIQFAARIPTEPCAGSSQVVRCKGRDTDCRGGRPYYMPYSLFADALPEHAPRAADPAKDLPAIDGSRMQPAEQLRMYPVRHRDRANVSALADEIDDGPVVFSLLQVLNPQGYGFVSS